MGEQRAGLCPCGTVGRQHSQNKKGHFGVWQGIIAPTLPMSLFTRLIIRLFQLVFSVGTVTLFGGCFFDL
jgi:hypothetical protein